MSGRVASVARRLSASLRHPWGGPRLPGEAPIVRGWLPFIGCGISFGRDMPSFLRRCQQRHGSTFTLHMLGRRMTFLLDPRDYAQVFKNGHALSFDPISRVFSARAFGYGAIYDTALTEAQLRESYARHLRPSSLGPLAKRTQDELARQLAVQIEALGVGEGGWSEVELTGFVSRCVFGAGVNAMFGEGSTDAAIHEHFVRYDRHFARLVAGVPMGLLGSARSNREALVQRLRRPWPRASAFIEERRELLSRYVDDAEAARVRTSMLWASQANTIPAVFWVLAFLLEHPEALAAILPEIDAAVQREEDGSPRLDLDARPTMRYFDSAILEMLRLCSGSISLRRVLEPLTLELASGDRRVLRPGDDLSVYPYLGHRDPEVFEEPERYRFDRFHVERGAKQFRKGGERLIHALLPFGGGESMCPGRFLAQSEIKMFISMLLADYDVELMPGEVLPGLDQSRSGLGLLPPAGPLRARLRRRAAR